jgi:hypothetical protein
MNEVGKPELPDTMPDLSASFVQVSSDATRRLCEQGQSVAKTISDLNIEVIQFVAHRVARNGEAMGRLTKCQSFPEAFAVQAHWLQASADDYLKEMSKLTLANSRVMSGLVGSIGQVGMQSTEQTRSSTAKVPMRTAS